ncbi:MAG: hypothetical protein LUH22_17840 [Bacteroides sp.]|nr:hypothetical protein [Bacteroides sp.]
MKSGKNKWLNKSLKILLYFLLITGIVPTLMLYDVLPHSHTGVWIWLHLIPGYIFLVLVLVHCIIYRKWYKAWFAKKLKSPKTRLTKFISVFFVLTAVSLLLEDWVSSKVFLTIHIVIGGVWMIGMLYHIKGKKRLKMVRKG